MTRKTFAWEPQHFATVEAFRAYTETLTVPAWVSGTTLHHTYIPVPAQWRGPASMEGLRAYYRDTKKWDAGPHLFLCAGAPNPANDGIFIGTPLRTQGIHAGVCNDDHWGIEIVGDYDKTPWSPRLKSLIYGTVEALEALGHFGSERVQGHRECLANKSCPGAAINMNVVRAELEQRATATGKYVRVVAMKGANMRQGPATSFPIAAALPFDYVFYADKSVEGESLGGNNVWWHMWGPDNLIENPLGFCWSGICEQVE